MNGQKNNMDYTIIKHNTIEGLGDEAIVLIESGWIPQGGVAIGFNQYTGMMEYAQAFIKS